MLAAVQRHQREQRRLLDLGLADTHRAARRSVRTAAAMVGLYQAHAAEVALAATDDVLAEQRIDPTTEADVNAQAFVTGRPAADMLDNAQTSQAFDLLVATMIPDAARDATAVSNATRPAVTGYVRAVSSPCCSRCAILAGRVYRWSQGFQRHPRCDCQNVPTNRSVGPSLVTDAGQMFREGNIRGLSRADTKAVNMGADLGQVVNVRRKSAGLIEGSSVMVRAARPTPAYILRVASDRADALSLFRRFGYVT